MMFCDHGDFEEGYCEECTDKEEEERHKMRGSESHYKVVCKTPECGKVMEQCRCPSPDKKIHYEICDECKIKEKEEEADHKFNDDWE